MASSTQIFESRVTPSCPAATKDILQAAWNHDAPTLKGLLDAPGKASCQEPTTGETPLHAAIRSTQAKSADDFDLETAKKVVHDLFLHGAIWNDVDDHNDTPGCLALKLGQKDLYTLCMEAGIRAELLFGLMDGYEELSSGSEDEEEEEDAEAAAQDIGDGAAATENGGAPPTDLEVVTAEEPKFVPPQAAEGRQDVTSEAYLRSKLTYSEGKLVDDDGNGVMMAWETDIMRRSVDALLPGKEAGKRILNIGFGMGIIDTMFAETKPARHHIIEAHPEVLTHLAEPESKFGAKWEESGPEPGAFTVHKGKWQDICPQLIERGEVFDAIYFDTFGEDYGQLRNFFTEYIPGLLDQDGVFGFFNGLGADRRICYDVYTKVVEIQLADAGLDVDWDEIDVDMQRLAEAGKDEWEGVKRRYWTLDTYRLPKCTFLG